MVDCSFPLASARPYYATPNGLLFEGDCLEILPRIGAGVIDMVFADPPFNLGKTYGQRTNDSRADIEYIAWCREWLAECIRVLKPGGALFIYNLDTSNNRAFHLKGGVYWAVAVTA